MTYKQAKEITLREIGCNMRDCDGTLECEDCEFDGGDDYKRTAQALNFILDMAESQIETVTKCNGLQEQIERMAAYITNFDNDENICKNVGVNDVYNCKYETCLECIIKYFESEVEL